MNDLISIQAFAAMWSGQKPGQIIATLLDLLVRMLELDFAYSRFGDSLDGSRTELVREALGQRQLNAREVGHGLEPWFSGDGPNSFVMANPSGTGEISVAICRLGLLEEMGSVAAACRRKGFPSATDTLLLRVAGNQAAIALQEARRLRDQKRAAAELEEHVEERTRQLSAVNLELRKEISERQHAEAEQRKFSSLVVNSNDFIGIASLDGQPLFVNRAGQQIVGLGRGEQLPKTILEYIAEEDRERMEQEVMPILERDGHWAGELRFRHFITGESIPMLMQLFFIKEQSGDGRIAMATISRDISARKHGEQVLRDSEERFRLMVEGIKDYAIYLLDSEGRVTSWNAGAERLKGYTEEEVLGRHYSKFYTPEERAKSKPQRHLDLAAAAGRVETQGWRLRKDGTRFWADVLMTALRNQQGKLVGFSKLTRDITERRKAEEELRAVKDQLAAELTAMTRLHELSTRLLASTELQPLLEEVLDAIMALLNADLGNVQLYNQKTQALEIVAQRGFGDEFLAHFNGVQESTASRGTALLSGKRVIVEDVRTEPSFTHLEPIAAAGFLALQSTPLFNRTGEPLGMISTYFRKTYRPSELELRFTDLYARQAAEMIERKRSEEKLQRSETYLAEGQRISQTGSWVWNVSTGELFWSDEQFRIFDLDPNWGPPSLSAALQLIHPDDRPGVQQSLEKALRETSHSEWDCRIVTLKGDIKIVHTTAHPVFASGILAEYVGTTMDISARKQAEDALNEAREELTRVSRAVTIGELAASIAHEVNQPLAAVVTNASAGLRWLAGDTPNLDEARQVLRRIIRDSNRASDVIAKIRSLVQKAVTAKEEFDLKEAIAETITLAQAEMRRRDVALCIEMPDDLPAVIGDRVQLQQVMLNLIMNGIDAMSEVSNRPRELVVAAAQDLSDKIRVSVRDSGTGVQPQNLARVFEAFYTTKPHGIGIGLSISRSIIEAHGGRLWAVQNESPGATFQFTLPTHASSSV
jgi:PAS domain S-box-containing protein